MAKFRRTYLGLIPLALMVAALFFRTSDRDVAEKISEVGADWAWEVDVRELSDVHYSRVVSQGYGLREGLKKFWLLMLADSSRTREYQLRWGQEVFTLWSFDQGSLPQLAALRRLRVRNPGKFQEAVDELVENQMRALLKASEEDFDLETETISFLPLLHLEDS